MLFRFEDAHRVRTLGIGSGECGDVARDGREKGVNHIDRGRTSMWTRLDEKVMAHSDGAGMAEDSGFCE